MSRQVCIVESILLALAGLGLLGTAAQGGTTTRVSVATDGTQGDHSSQNPSISSDGRFVAFFSNASNLVPGAESGFSQVLVNDLQTGKTTCVSVASDGSMGNGDSYTPSISSDGRFVAFASFATNLAPGSTPGPEQVFVHDRQKAVTTCVSVDAFGIQGNDLSNAPSISGDGQFVAFESYATDLVPGGTSGNGDVFVHDLLAGKTTCVSVASNGTPGNGYSDRPSISSDGLFVAFDSVATNLVPGATSGKGDVFVRGLPAGPTTCVSVASDGTQANNGSAFASISSDGQFVAFSSLATNLVPGDTNGKTDVFVHDRQTRATTRVSLSSGGIQGNGNSGSPSISGDGRFVAFHSDATNLVHGATKGGVFVRDTQAGQTTCVSVASDGTQGNGYSDLPSISANGGPVAFESDATNLVAGDTNKTTDVFVHHLGAPPPLPDLQGCACTTLPAALWGQAINVACQIKNAGGAAAGAFHVEWFLSLSATGSTTDDIPLSQANGKGTSYSHAGIAAGAKGPAFTVALQLPSALPSGWSGTNFYIKMAVNNDFASLGQGLDWAPIVIQAPVEDVVSPHALQVWLPGKAYPIIWTDFIASTVKVALYKGGTLNKPIAASTSSKVSIKWTVPGNQPLGADYAVKVSSTSPAASAFSATFAIANPKVTYPALAGIAWLGGTSRKITWSGFPEATVNVDLYKGAPPTFLRNIIGSTPNPPTGLAGSYTWLVPADLAAGTDYTISVSSPTNPNLAATLTPAFTIAQPQVASPPAGAAWLGTDPPHNITWAGYPAGKQVKIDLYRGTALSQTLNASVANTGSGSWPWKVPSTVPADSDYKVKVTWTGNSGVFGFSNPFTVAAPQVTYPPAANVVLRAGKSATLTWKGFPGKTVDIGLVEGGNVQVIKAAAANSGSFLWAVPPGQTPATDYQVKVTTTSGPPLSALGKTFTISAP